MDPTQDDNVSMNQGPGNLKINGESDNSIHVDASIKETESMSIDHDNEVAAHGNSDYVAPSASSSDDLVDNRAEHNIEPESLGWEHVLRHPTPRFTYNEAGSMIKILDLFDMYRPPWESHNLHYWSRKDLCNMHGEVFEFSNTYFTSYFRSRVEDSKIWRDNVVRQWYGSHERWMLDIALLNGSVLQVAYADFGRICRYAIAARPMLGQDRDLWIYYVRRMWIKTLGGLDSWDGEITEDLKHLANSFEHFHIPWYKEADWFTY